MSSARLVIAFVFFQLSGTSLLFCQRFLTTFGRVAELHAGRDARGIFEGDFNGDGLPDLATFGGTQIAVNYHVPGSSSWRAIPLHFQSTIVQAVAARCNADRYDDIIVLTDHPPQLKVLLGKSHERFYPIWTMEIHGSFGSLGAADVNSDGYTDLTLSGKKELGVAVFLGRGDGTYSSDTTLLPEYPVSALSIVDMNNDGLNDIIASNWVSNDLLVYTAFGQMKFSEPSVLHFSSEATHFTIAYLDSDASADLVVAIADEKTCQIFLGDGLGGFRLMQSISVPYKISRLGVADINGDEMPDVCLLSRTNRSLGVHLNSRKGTMADEIIFAAGKAPSSFCFSPAERGKLTDLAILDETSSKIRLLVNAKAEPSREPEVNYATGLSPGDVVVTDCNQDGWNDIIVASASSPDISLYLNNEQGVVDGQIEINVPARMQGLTSLPKDDTTIILVGTSPAEDLISIMELNTRELSRRSFTLPTQGPADILKIRLDSAFAHLMILALEHDQHERYPALILFEQIAPTRFVERSIMPKLLTPVITAVIDDRKGDGVFLAYDAKSQQQQLFVAAGPVSENYPLQPLGLAFHAPSAGSALLWIANVNNDSTPDLLLNRRAPENVLVAFPGVKDSFFSQRHFQFKSSVSISSSANLKVLDINGDAITDVVCLNDLQKSIECYIGEGSGTFLPPIRLASAEGVGGFSIGDLNHDMIPELIMTDAAEGLLKIISLRQQ